MNVFDNNIKKEFQEYTNNLETIKDESFVSQFKLQEINNINEASKEKYTNLNNPSIFNLQKDNSKEKL